MASKNDSNWYQNYEALKAYIQERGHLPDKHVVTNLSLLSWAKYQRKKIKEGTLDEEKRNQVLKESPFALVKTLKLTLYHPNGVGVFSTETYTIEDERNYSELIDVVKHVINLV